MTGVSIRTVALTDGRNPFGPTLTLVGFRTVTKHGKSDGPLSGVHSTARPSGPATDVKVPHSCATRSGLDSGRARTTAASSLGPLAPGTIEVPANTADARKPNANTCRDFMSHSF